MGKGSLSYGIVVWVVGLSVPYVDPTGKVSRSYGVVVLVVGHSGGTVVAVVCASSVGSVAVALVAMGAY